MSRSEFEIYLITLLISLILSLMMTGHWRASGAKRDSARAWMIASWIMTLANVVFLFQTIVPTSVGRVSATLLVTASLLAVWMGAENTGGRPTPWRGVLLVLGAHLPLLVFFQVFGHTNPWRMVSNGLFWTSLSFCSFFALRRTPDFYWKRGFSPAVICLLHGCFHATRITLALLFAAKDWSTANIWLHTISDMSASCFNVALFASLLIADIHLRHEELNRAREEVTVLSGLLPVCAWCKKIRDDQGYWQQVDEYLAKQGKIQITHGICHDCLEKQLPR